MSGGARRLKPGSYRGQKSIAGAAGTSAFFGLSATRASVVISSEATEAASIEALAGATAPVLLILGSISRSPFRIGTDALATRLADARVVKSVPLLDKAALDAVRQWEYRPSLLNGVPTAVVTTVTVKFTRP